MSHTPRVAVVGAGIVGLATAAALVKAGAEVRLYEREAPGLGQSVGRTRVFRLAHRDARLVELATRSERLWHTWETRFRRRLLGDEGLIVTGDDTVAAWTEGMSGAGARYSVLSMEEARARLPVARPVGSVALFDPGAGPIRARRTVECLLAASGATLRIEEVVEIVPTAAGCLITTSMGSWECEEAVIAAGTETGRLAAAAGIGVEMSIVHDSRFTYSIRQGYRDGSLACWFDTTGTYGPGYSSYGQRVGSSSLYAVAVGWDETRNLTADEEVALHRQKSWEYIREAYPGLDPVPVDEIRCTYAMGDSQYDGDGFMARRSGGVTALYGNNLFKFAPLFGELLCRTALTGVLADELALDGSMHP